MNSISELVTQLIKDEPKVYGSDRGTKRLFAKVLEILEKEPIDGAATLTTVERVRRKFLADNPQYDHRDKDTKARRA